MATTEKTTPVRDQKLVRHLAKSLFLADFGPTKVKDKDERKAAWTEHKSEYTKRGRRLYRIMERRGCTFTVADKAKD